MFTRNIKNLKNQSKDFIKQCPTCENKIGYTSMIALEHSIQKNTKCRSCINKEVHIKRNNSNFQKKCSTCEKIIKYSNEKQMKLAIKNNSICLSCSAKKSKLKEKKYSRNCPKCKKLIWYSDEKNLKKAEQLNIACQSCINKEINSRPETKEKKSKASSGKNNPMYKKSYFDIWVKKYGIEEAEKREIKKSMNTSRGISGKNNPMYGRPSPQGSGNGWKGWYKGIYFASLNELFFIKYLLDNNIKFENGEKRKYKIQYEFMGEQKNYFLDFYLPETDEYIEIKPKKLINSPKNNAKFKAAKRKLGNKFKILTEDNIENIDLEQMYNLYLSKRLIFMKKYEDKFLDYYYKNRKE